MIQQPASGTSTASTDIELVLEALARLDQAPPTDGGVVFANLFGYLSARVVPHPLRNISFSASAGYLLVDLVLSAARPCSAIAFLLDVQRALARLSAGCAVAKMAPRNPLGRLTVRGHDLNFTEVEGSCVITAIRRRPSRRRPKMRN